MKKIKHIFINTKENKLRLAEVVFTDKIQEIKFLSDEIEWAEINEKKPLDQFRSKHKRTSDNEDIIDGDFNLLMPGAIDPHVHFDTPGFEFREDFEHASTAAAYGGVTTIIDMPCTSIPPVTNGEYFRTKLDEVKQRSLIDFAFWGGVSGTDINDLSKVEKQVNELSELGVAGYKVYLISGMEDFTDLTYEQIKYAADIIKRTNKPMAVHAENKSLVLSRQNEFEKSNQNEWQHYCTSRDIEAEVTAVKELIKIAEAANCRTHIVHLSSAKGLKLISEAKRNGIPVSTETCPHYLYFTQDDFENHKIRNYLKTAPPVKFQEDRDALWGGLKNSELEFVTTDHAGCNPDEEKSSDNFWKVYGGIPGIEHRVPFLFSEGFFKNRISLKQTIDLLSANAASFFNLKSKGKLEKGYDADFALMDLWSSQTIRSKEIHSKGKYTPMEGIALNCIVLNTFLRGKTIWDRGKSKLGEIGYGQFIKVESR